MNLENAYALLIGVGQDLPITVNDANSIAEVLINKSKAAYNINNVVVLTEKEATRENVLKELENIVEKTKIDNDATVIIYYSGHGGRYRHYNGSDYYLLTSGYNPKDRDNTMVKGDEFSKLVNSITANRLLVMLDCCHAAGIISKDKPLLKSKSEDNQIVNSNIELLKKLKSGEGKVFITSCDDDEQSVILPNSRNSLFTEVVIEALQGYASKGEEFVRIIDILYHVLNEVPNRIKNYSFTQRPIINKVNYLSPDFFICKTALHLKTDKFKEVVTSVDMNNLAGLTNRFNIENSNKPIVISENDSTEELNYNNEKKLEILKEIASSISLGQTEKAILKFVEITKTHLPDYKNQSYLLAYKYNVLINDKMIGDLDDKTYRQELVKIARGVQFFTEKAAQSIHFTSN